MFRPLGVIIRSSLRTYYLHPECSWKIIWLKSDVSNRFLSSTWWWPPRVETCCNFKPTIKVVLTEIYILFIVEFMSFTYTSKNFLLKIGIIFSLFFGLDKHKFFECPVTVWSVIIEDQLSSQQASCILFTANKLPNWNEIRPSKMWRKK